MTMYRNILFFTQGLADDTASLTQALKLVKHTQAQLHILIISPELPPELEDYRATYDTALHNTLSQALNRAYQTIFSQPPQAAPEFKGTPLQLTFPELQHPIHIHLERGSMPTVRTIRHILRNNHDLLIKTADFQDDNTGYRAIDLELLRKCPCPVLLHHGTIFSPTPHVAVAIDPISSTPEGHQLSLSLLQHAAHYGAIHQSIPHVLACWEYAMESTLRDSPWFKIPARELETLVTTHKDNHLQALNNLIDEATLLNPLPIEHLRGRPDKCIPTYMQDHGGLLIMGTVARTGIPGFVIGNTAENIVQNLNCSLLAIKPEGFITPIQLEE